MTSGRCVGHWGLVIHWALGLGNWSSIWQNAAMMRIATISLLICSMGTICLAADLYVGPDGSDRYSGLVPEANRRRTDGPLATLRRAVDVSRVTPGPKRIIVREGTYYLPEPIALTPADSGLSIVAYPNERPVISGGRPIEGWRKTQNQIWAAPVLEARTARWDFRLLRVDDRWETLARYPNVDPADPLKSGWLHVARGRSRGAFGGGVGGIQNEGDWLEWKISVPADGNYWVWFYYAAQNRPYGFRDMAGRCAISVDQERPIPLRNLPDTGSFDKFQWGHVVTVPLSAGRHTIRWTNVDGGGINLDAMAFCTDAQWIPAAKAENPAAPGRHLMVIQAESFTASKAKEMQVTEGQGGVDTDQFQFAAGEIRRFPRSPNPEIHIFPGEGWVNSILNVVQIDPEARTVFLEKNSSASEDLRPGNRYYVANVLEELDQPGEWYLDRQQGWLYYWPSSRGFPNQTVVAPVLDRLITINGDPARNRWASNITIRGLEFRDTSYSGSISVYMPADAAVWISGGRDCVVEGNRFVTVGGYGVRLDNRSRGCEIVGNEIAWNGEGGVILVGESAATQPIDNLIAGNWIHHGGQVYKHVAGVYCTTASGTRVANNQIDHMPRYGISFKSYDRNAYSHDNTAEYNDILFTNLETSDSGAIETLGRDQQDSGNVIRGNRIMDVVGMKDMPDGRMVSPFMTWGIYLDDYSSGTIVRGNIVARTHWGAVCVHGGRNNLIENNIFAEGETQQMRYQVRDAFSRNNRFVRNIVYFTGEGADVFKHTGEWRRDVLSESDNNLYWHGRGAGFFEGRDMTPMGTMDKWRGAGFDRRSVFGDPRFVDPGHDDFRIRPDSPALRLGFQPIAVEKIGLAGYPRAWRRRAER
jgi:parallel beta-helix repeat protein